MKDGLLTQDELAQFDFGTDPEVVDYGALYNNRYKMLKIAYEKFMKKPDKEFADFKKANADWLDDYCLYTVIKAANEGENWTKWAAPLRLRDKDALDKARKQYADEIDFCAFQQYEFMKQWLALKAYANENGIKIIGDIPFYTAFDSADTWGNPEMFLFDEDNKPTKVAGCPPDAFSPVGQLWGNPIYNWAYLKKENYAWWIARIRHNLKLCDVLRVDHFRAFDAYYEIPGDAKDAVNGKWVKGPGMALFKAVKKELGDVEMIAEDLGYITESVKKLVKNTGFPGMKVLQFAFDSREESDYLPHNYEHNCVVYTGTHDNETTRGWIENIPNEDRDFARRYINSLYTNYDAFTWDFIRCAQASTADLCIVPIQDYLVKGNEARMNHPSTLGKNWKWRIKPNYLSKELAKSIYEMTKLYCRVPKVEKEEEEEKDAKNEPRG